MNNRMKNALEDVRDSFISKAITNDEHEKINKVINFLHEMISDTDEETNDNIETVLNITDSFKHSMINIKRLLKE